MAFVHKGRSIGVYGRLIDLGGYRGLYVKVWEFHLDLPTIGFVFWHDSYRNHLDGVSRGILDTNKVLKANHMAIELTKYDGPIAEEFELLETQVAGKSIEDLEEISAEN